MSKQNGRAPPLCYYTLHNTYYTNTCSFLFSLVTSSFSLKHPFSCFHSIHLCLFFRLCQKPHNNPFPSFLLLPFCSLALPPFTSDISQMAYSNWNLLFCQDKKTSVSPKRYTMKLKIDSLLRSGSISILLLFCHFSCFRIPSLAIIVSLCFPLLINYLNCNAITNLQALPGIHNHLMF